MNASVPVAATAAAPPAGDGSVVEQMLAGRVTAEMTFSQRVWALTARIPRGRVATYGQLAQALGSRGARAVGNALRCNPHAPAVPCHRVVARDGRLNGFAQGLERKRELLEAEAVAVEAGRVDLARFGVAADVLAGGEPVPALGS